MKQLGEELYGQSSIYSTSSQQGHGSSQGVQHIIYRDKQNVTRAQTAEYTWFRQ